MPFADTSLAQLYYLQESQWGVTPAAALKSARFTGESLNFNIDNTQSNEIRSDRQITDLIQTDAEPNGDINFELSFGAYDDFLEGALFDSWGSVINESVSDIEAVAGTPDNFTSTTTDFTTLGLKTGQWIKIAGFSTNESNNGFFKILSIAANKLEVAGENALTNEAAGDTIAITGQNLRNGTTKKSYSLETKFADVTQFKSFTGMLINNMSLNLSVGEILNGTFGFIGKDASLQNASIGTGQPEEAPANDVLNAVNNVAHIVEGGDNFSGELQEFSISLTNNLRSQKAVGTLGSVGIGAGRVGITGNFNAYFENDTLYKKYLNGTETSIAMRLTDSKGNTYIITLPRIKFTGGNLAAGSPDSDVVVEMEYQALMDASDEFTMQIDKFGV